MAFVGMWALAVFSPALLFAADRPPLAELEQRLAAQQAEIMRLQAAAAAEEARVAAQEAAADKAALEKAKLNFKVTAPTPAIAEKVREAAARTWMQSRLNGLQLAKPCPITVKVGQIGAGGATTFSFAGGQVFGWQMNVQGSLERVLDSVIPHEVCHMLNACDTRRPLPRWADEGVATLFEADSERARQLALAREIVGTRRFIPVRELLSITEYPKDMQAVLALYAEGSMLTDFLVKRAADTSGEWWTQERARQWMVDFIDYARTAGWDAALYKYKDDVGGLSNVADLTREFEKWLKGNGALYVFNTPAPAPAGDILPVGGVGGNRNVVPLGR